MHSYHAQKFTCPESDVVRHYDSQGRFHCTKGPALISKFRTEWQIHGVLHRDDGGPVYESVDGHKEWRYNGKLHCATGPAIIRSNGDLSWYTHGIFERHLKVGMRCHDADHHKEWYIYQSNEPYKIFDKPTNENIDDNPINESTNKNIDDKPINESTNENIDDKPTCEPINE